MKKLFVVFAVVFLLSTPAFASDMTAEDYDTMENQLRMDYPHMIDSLHNTIDQIDGRIYELKALDSLAEAIFLCQSMEWLATDLYNASAKGERTQFLRMFSKYTKMKKDTLLLYPLSRQAGLKAILAEAKAYYKQSAARKVKVILNR
jgi:hypothetical protein